MKFNNKKNLSFIFLKYNQWERQPVNTLIKKMFSQYLPHWLRVSLYLFYYILENDGQNIFKIRFIYI